MNQNNKYRYLAKNTLLFGISSFGTKILVFLLVPLYTSILSTADYGIIDIITTTSSLLIYVFTINIQESVLRFAIDKKVNNEPYLAYGLKIVLIGSGVFAGVLLVSWHFQLVKWADFCYVFLFFVYFFQSIYNIFTNYLRAIDNIKAVVVSGLLTTAITILFNIILLVFLKLGIVGYLISMVGGYVVPCVYCMVVLEPSLRKLNNAKCDAKTRWEMRKYSIPLIFNGVAWWMNNGINKYFIAVLCGAAQNGIFAVAFKIPTILTVFHSVFSQAWNLSAIKEFDRTDSDGFFSKTYTLYNAVLVMICSALILCNIPLARLLFAKDFFVAWQYSSILLISTTFSALSSFLGSVFTAVKDSRIFAVSTITAAVVNCIMSALLIPAIGVLGASIATAGSFCVIWLIRLICTRKYIKWHFCLYRDLIAYALLVVQVFFEHKPNHFYLGQFAILVILVVLYREQFMKCVLLFVSKARGILKGFPASNKM